MYKPKIVTGRVKDTGYPIDGHVLYFGLWDYDNHESWHLYGWDDEPEGTDEALMLTMFQTETEAGLCLCDTLEAFAEKWKAKEWEPAGPFCLPLDKVEVIEVKQEEKKDDARERMIAHGIDLSPRKETDRGGFLCLPMKKNLNGDIKAKHPDWTLIKCPHCGRECWKPSGVDELVEKQGVTLLCTECALSAGLVRPYGNNTPNPAGNRAKRRDAAKRYKRAQADRKRRVNRGSDRTD